MPARRPPAKDPNLAAFATNLIHARKQRGLSQVELAAKVGIAQPNISDYERGNVRPSLDIFVALVRALEVSADELLGFEPARQPAVKDRRLIQHVALIERLPRRDRDALLRTIRLYVDRVA
jgi:transcriptional regulator with XRE-family HTH domain